MKLSIIKAQIKATHNMLNEFGKLKSQGIDSGYDTKELDTLRSATKSAITKLTTQMRNHPDYVWDYDLLATGEIQ